MTSHCAASDNKATVIIYGENKQEVERIVLNSPPVEVSITETTEPIIYSHPMTRRIDRTFDTEILSVEIISTGNQWTVGDGVMRPCPSPAVTNKKIFAEFDSYPGGIIPPGQSSDPYANNTGTCIYRINLKNGYVLKTISSSGQITRFYQQKINYKVSCGDEYPQGQHKVVISEYPGYCCMDCASLAAEVRSMRNMVKSL